jgi:hypothetical protein
MRIKDIRQHAADSDCQNVPSIHQRRAGSGDVPAVDCRRDYDGKRSM